MPADLSSYLATHYLTADPKPSSKKRKRKHPESSSVSSGLIIADDSETGWSRGANAHGDEADAAVVAGTSAEFRKAKKSAWKVVGASASAPKEAATQAPPQQDDASKEADAILASAAAEAQQNAEKDDEAPVMMSDGTYAGLQTAEAVAAQLERRRRAERAEFERMRKNEKEAETVYRDATGRRVDISFKKAEARRAAQEVADKERRAKEALKGEVQVEEARRRKEQLEDAKIMGVARTADDEDLNRELRAQTRWGDTMAQFISKDSGAGPGPSRGGRASGKNIKGRPVYQGAFQPNRYGIRPGYRWDGVDRGNGFEAERFRAMNRVERNKGLEYNWQMDE